MKTEKKIFIILAVYLAVVFFPSFLLAGQEDLCKPSKAEVIQKVQKLQIPFVANNGQIDERVKFYANTFGGTVFITKDGEIVYSLAGKDMEQETSIKGLGSDFKEVNYEPRVRKDGILSKSEILDLFLISCGNPISETISSNADYQISHSTFHNPQSAFHSHQSEVRNPKSETKTVALKEEFVGGKISEIKGEEKAVTNVNYFKGKDPSKWKTNISTYEVVSLGEIYDGIELKLKAYGNNVEKLFCVKPGADPDQIKIRLSGVKDCGVQNAECGIENPKLQINKSGELEVETELGTVKFTKPVAYQEIDGKRVNVTVEYNLLNLKSAIQSPKSVYGFKVASYDRTKDLIIDPLLASTYLGGSSGDGGYSIAIDSSENIYVAGWTSSSDFPTTTGAYDTSFKGGGYEDVFVLKINGSLTSLLASTFLGGSKNEYANSIVVDSNGNIYIVGTTGSSDFPTTTSAYDISFNGGDSYYGDAFVSKLNSDLTSLLASTLLGGYYNDECNFIAIDSGGNVYLTGWTYSSDFPTTTGAYDTSFNGGYYDTYGDAFVSKLSGDLTSLLSSTFLGGADSGGSDSWDDGQSIAIDSGGNVYVAGYTQASDFPTTSGAYDTFFNGGYGDTFVSKLNGDLTSLHASTFLGGSSWDRCYSSIAIDSSGNIYVSGVTDSLDFPTTISAYDTFFNGGYSDVFVSKLNSDLTSLLASTFLGGDDSDRGNFITIDSGGNIYLTGYTYSSKFPTTTGAYDTSYNGSGNAFVSKLNGDLANLLSSTFLGLYAAGRSIAINSDGNIYVAGGSRSDFPTTTGAYDTSYNGGGDVFVSKFDSNLSASPPSVTTGSATNVTSSSATLNGIVNANGLSTTVWFQYDTVSGSYTNTSSKHTVTGTSDTTVSTSISGLSSGTTYYYRIAAQNSVGTAYGSELSFTTVTPTPSPKATPTQPTCTDNYEPNDSSSTAYGPLSSGSSYSGKVCSNSDVDWFKVNITSAGTISLNLTVPSSNDYNLELYNPSYTWVAGSYNGTGVSESISYNATTAGNYYLRIYGKSGSYNTLSSYTLTYTYTAIISDTTPPTVSSTSPSNGDTSVAVNTSITATFSEDMDATTINTSTFTLSNGVTGTVSYDSTTKTATFTPSSSLNYSTTYTATITTGVKDISGNAMATNYTWSFTTATVLDCISTPEGFVNCLVAVDSTLLEDRIPLILIHGWNSIGIPAPPKNESWEKFITYYNKNMSLRNTYKLYRFSYYSNSIGINLLGAALRDVLDNINSSDPTNFGSKQIAIIGHSMGGLIGREFMIRRQFQGAFAGKLGGERVLKLITLGTPHHGSPMANGQARNAKALSNKRLLELFDFLFYTKGGPAYDQVNRSELRWDNYDKLLNYDIRSFPETEQDIFLGSLNSDTRYDTKIIAYAGEISTDDEPEFSVYDFGTTVMEGDFKLSSDGIVPTKSAHFDGHEVFDTRYYSGYNHTEIVEGQGTNDNSLFDQISQDLLSVPTTTPTPIVVESPTPAICEAEFITISPSRLVLKIKEHGDVTVAVEGDDGCPVEDVNVTASINVAGKNHISISPKSTFTNEEGKATFTITAKTKTGEARVTFKAGSLKKSIIVKVRE